MGTQVLTVLEASLPEDRWAVLVEAYRAGMVDLPPQIVRTTLVQGREDRNLWRMETLWTSLEGLQQYRDSVDVPGGIANFRAAGTEPHLTVFEVVAEA